MQESDFKQKVPQKNGVTDKHLKVDPWKQISSSTANTVAENAQITKIAFQLIDSDRSTALF